MGILWSLEDILLSRLDRRISYFGFWLTGRLGQRLAFFSESERSTGASLSVGRVSSP